MNELNIANVQKSSHIQIDFCVFIYLRLRFFQGNRIKMSPT